MADVRALFRAERAHRHVNDGVRLTWLTFRVQPMLIYFYVDGVLRLTRIFRPDVALQESHSVQWLARQSAPRIGEFFGIAIYSTKAFNNSALAADIGRRSNMPERIDRTDGDYITRTE